MGVRFLRVGGADERCSPLRFIGELLLFTVGLEIFHQGVPGLWVGGVVNAGAIAGGNIHKALAHKMDVKQLRLLISCEEMQGNGPMVIAVAAGAANNIPTPGEQISQILLIMGAFQNVQQFFHSFGGLLFIFNGVAYKMELSVFKNISGCVGEKSGDGAFVVGQEDGSGMGPKPPNEQAHKKYGDHDPNSTLFHRATSFANSFF